MRGRWRGVIGAMAAAPLIAGAAIAAGSASPDPITAERARLVAAKRAADLAQARSTRLDGRAAAEQDAANRAQMQEQAVMARIDRAQADIAAAQARIVLVNAALAAQRTRLAAQQRPVARLLAALTSFARRPAIAAVAQPGSIDDMVHVRAVLGTVTPAIAARTADLRGELAQTRSLRQAATLAVRSLADSRAALDQQQLALARLEMTHRQRSVTLGRAALVASDQALAMGEAAQEAIGRMAAIGDQASTRAALAALPDPTAPPDDSRAAGLSGAWPVGAAPYGLPVDGALMTGFGEVSDSGVRSRGLTIAVAPDTPVIAPAAGRVAYARHFGEFGTVVIIDHGAGWTTLISGLARASLIRGDAIAARARIGMAGADGRVTIELRRRGRPVDMTPLLG